MSSLATSHTINSDIIPNTETSNSAEQVVTALGGSYKFWKHYTVASFSTQDQLIEFEAWLILRGYSKFTVEGCLGVAYRAPTAKLLLAASE